MGLDFDRYGIVAQSRIFPYKRGGALPNTQVFISEIEHIAKHGNQCRHRAWRTARPVPP